MSVLWESKRYCKLDVPYTLKSLFDIVQNASTANLLQFGYQYCIEVKDTANWMLYMHGKVCMNIVQNASSVNLLQIGCQYCIEVRYTANWKEFMPSKVYKSIIQNA